MIRDASQFASEDSIAWSSFVAHHPASIAYHQFDWVDLFCRFYGYKNRSLLLRDSSGAARALLPLCEGRRLTGSRSLISLPHHAYAGILADGDDSARAILDGAIDLADRLGVHDLQIRSFQPLADSRFVILSQKVHTEVDLSRGSAAVWKGITNNLRWEIKKAYKSGIQVHIGGRELLPQFLQVYQPLERELGVPGHGNAFFGEVLDCFGDRCRIFNSYVGNDLAGSILAVGYKDRFELVWGGTPAPFKASNSTAMLFWRAACWAQQHGYKRIDFGRSTVGSSVHRFKQKWRSPERTLYYHYYLRKSQTPPDYSTANKSMQGAVSIWKRLPLPICRFVGGKLIKYFF